jgi:hypothetical protein
VDERIGIQVGIMREGGRYRRRRVKRSCLTTCKGQIGGSPNVSVAESSSKRLIGLRRGDGAYDMGGGWRASGMKWTDACLNVKDIPNLGLADRKRLE